MNKKQVIKNLYEKYIKGTPAKILVVDKTVFVCCLTHKVAKVTDLDFKAYINTTVLKHIYDKRPAEEFDFLVSCIHTVVKYPDLIYKNKNTKRGDFCFVKELKCSRYLCSLEGVEKDNCKITSIVTAFRLRKENYLKSYELLWSWKCGDSSS